MSLRQHLGPNRPDIYSAKTAKRQSWWLSTFVRLAYGVKFVVRIDSTVAFALIPKMKRSLRKSWSPPGAGPQVGRALHTQPCSPAVGVELVVGDQKPFYL